MRKSSAARLSVRPGSRSHWIHMAKYMVFVHKVEWLHGAYPVFRYTVLITGHGE